MADGVDVKARVAFAADAAWEVFAGAVRSNANYDSTFWRRELMVSLAEKLAHVNNAVAAQLPEDDEAPE